MNMNIDSPISREQTQLATLEQRKASSLAQSSKLPLAHALNKIIQKCLLERGKEIDRDIQISIDYLDMPRSEVQEVRRFFMQLQKAGCFKKQACVANWFFHITRPDIAKLKAFQSKLADDLNIPSGSKQKNHESLRPIILSSETKWSDIAIKFIDGHNVEVHAESESWKRNYKEMGCEDEKKVIPDKQWELLKDLADNNGIIPYEESKKQIKLVLSNNLRKAFPNQKGSPIKFSRYDDRVSESQVIRKVYKALFSVLPEGGQPSYTSSALAEDGYREKYNRPNTNTRYLPNSDDLVLEE